MGNGRKQTALWLVFVEGAALSLGIYLLLTVLLSALVVKAVLHNLYFYNELAARIRRTLDEGTFADFRARYSGNLEKRA